MGWLEQTQKKYKLTPSTTANKVSSTSGTGWVESVQKKQPQKVYSQYQPKKVSTTPVKIAQPKKVETKPNLIQQAGNSINQAKVNTGNFIKEVKSLDFERIKTALSSGVKSTPGTVKVAGGVIAEGWGKQQKVMDQFFKATDKVTLPGMFGEIQRAERFSRSTREKASNKAIEVAPKIREQGYKDVKKAVEPYAKLGPAKGNAQTIAEAMVFNVPQMALSTGLTVATGVITKNPALATAVGLSTSYGLGASEVYNTARENNISDKQALPYAMAGGFLIGALDFVPLGRLLRKLDTADVVKKTIVKKIASGVVSTGIQSGFEGITEGAQEIVGNAIESTYSENKDLFKNVGLSTVVGALFGGLADASISTVVALGGNSKSPERATEVVNKKIEEAFKTPTDKRTKEQQAIVDSMLARQFEPDEAISIVVENNLGKTEEGKMIMKAVLQAKEEGKEIKIVSTPDNKIASVEVVDPITATQTEPLPDVLEEELNKTKQIIKTPAQFKDSSEEQAFKYVNESPDKIVSDYISENQNNVNPDLALKLFKDYKGYNVDSYSRIAGAIKALVYNQLLKTEKGKRNNTVVITAGGSGSGKSTAVQTDTPLKDVHAIVLDTTFSNTSALTDIKKALDNGYKVNVAFTLRDIIDAWVKGAIPRIREEGRIVSEGYFVKSHKEAVRNFLKAYDKYKDDPNVQFDVFENTKKGFERILIDKLRTIKYNEAEVIPQIIDITEKAYGQKQITKEEYEAIKKDRPDVGRSDDGDGKQETPKDETDKVIAKTSNYTVTVDGVDIPVKVDKNWLNTIGTNHPVTHIEFDSNGIANPVSESGYKSHFIQQDLSEMSEVEFQKELQGLAENFAKENKPTAPQKYWLRNKSNQIIVEAHSSMQALLKAEKQIGKNITEIRSNNASGFKIPLPKKSLEKPSTPSSSENNVGDKVTFSDKDWTIKSIIDVGKDTKYQLIDSKGETIWTNEGGLKSEGKTAKEKVIFKRTTGQRNYDALIGDAPFEGSGPYKTLKEYFKEEKGQVGKIVEMTPDEYLSKIPQAEPSEASMERLRKAVEDGKKIDMLYLDSSRGTTVQEGRNRAYLAKEMGIKKIPVLVVEKPTTLPSSKTTKKKTQPQEVKSVPKNVGKVSDIKKAVDDVLLNDKELANIKRGTARTVIGREELYDGTETIYLSEIFNSTKGNKNASKLLDDLIHYADKTNTPISLRASVSNNFTDGKGLTQEQLVDWYKRKGFVSASEQSALGVNGGGDRDFMIYQPKSIPQSPLKSQPKTGAQEAFNYLKKFVGVDFIIQKPSNKLWVSKGNTLYIRLPKDSPWNITRFKNSDFIESAQEAGGNDVIKLVLKERQQSTSQQESKYTLESSKATNEKEIFKEIDGKDLVNALKYGDTTTYKRPTIGRLEILTLLRNNNEFKNDPYLTVINNKKGELKLVFEGKKFHFEINPDAMQLSIDNLRQLEIGTQIKVDKTLLTGKQHQLRVFKEGNSFASVGDYANIKNRTQEIQNAPIVEFPELVKIAKELMSRPVDIGVPRFRPTLGGRPNGLFQPRGDGRIILNPSIFKTPGQAAKTLAHELGHLADYLPEHTMKRGNLLGRIASLNKYMKTLLKESSDSEFDLITPKERAKIRAMAQKEGKNNYETVTREIEVGKEPTNPEEILSIWRDNTASIKNPELNSYIAGLSDERKKEIVVTAMRNKIPDWVTFMHTVKETVTEKVLRNSPQDIKALYKKMLKEEILKRRLFDLETIKKELTMLSQKWKPFNANLAPEGLVTYKQNPAELYADAISVLFNDPALLKEDAPTFWKAFFNYADQKPEVDKMIRGTWDLLNKGEEAVFEQRQKDVEQMFDNSEQKFTAKNLEKGKEKTNLVYNLKLLFNNENEPLIRRVKQAKKEGKTILDEQNPIFPYEGMAYMDGKLENFVQENFQPIFAKSQEMSSDGWQKLGSVLLYERSMNERGELANPLGFDPKTAGDQLRGLEKSMKPEDWQTLQDTLKLFRKANEKILNMAEESEFYSPELLAQMKANESYATYQVIDYLDTYVSAHVSKSIGTLKDIANPATSTVMKGISVVKAIERNNAKKIALAFFKENFPDEITPAKSIFIGKGRRQFVEPQEPDMKLIKLIEKGQMTAYYVEKDLADTINSQTNNTIIKTAKIARVLTAAGIYRPLFTSLNLGFSTFNFVRDFQRYWINVPDYTLLDAMTSFPRAVFRYGQAIPSASRRALGKNDKTITEMKELNILGATYRGVFEHNEVNPEDQQIERIMKRYGLLDEGKKRTILTPFLKLLDSIDGFNNFIETLPKVAGYNELKGKGRMTPHQLADFIRNDVGSPNFRTRGQLTPISNSILLFSNAIKEGIKSDVQVAMGRKGRQSASGFWWKTISSTMLPTMLMFAGSIGLLGKWYEDRMEDVSEYDKTNFTIIPLGVDEDGKTVALTVPRAETQRFLGGLLWKVMRNASRKDLKLEDVFDVFDYGAGQLPGVTPLWTGVGATIAYLSGHNPYDAFRNRNVIPDTEFKAGFKYSLPKFVDWLSKNQGAGIILPSYVPTDPTMLQKALSFPFVSNVIGRWIKSTDYGQTEANTRLNTNIDREKAQQNLDSRDKLDKALKEYRSGEQTKERRVKIVKQLIKDVVGPIRNSDDKRKRTALIKKFEIGVIEKKGNPLTNSIIDANTNDAKVQILLNAKKDLGDGFKDYVNNLYRNKVISVNVIKELKRRR